MLKRSIGSLLDQVLLSALNFGIAIALIQGISKASYGVYVQLFLFGLLVSTMADAFLANSFNILNNRSTEEKPPHLLQNSVHLSSGVAVVAAVLGIFLAAWLTRDWTDSIDRWTLYLIYPIYVFVLVTREMKRNFYYLTERWPQALFLDVAYALLCIFLLGLLWWKDGLTVSSVFAVLAASGWMANLVTPGLLNSESPKEPKALQALFYKSWSVSRWALPGAVVGWCINNAYLFVLGILAGAGATAEVNASKLAITPLVLSLVAWHQVSRSDIARLAQSDDPKSFKLFAIKSAILIHLPWVLYAPIFYIAYPWIDPYFSAKGYLHVDELLLLWFVFAAIAPIKYLGTSLLVGCEAFKPLFKLNLLSLVIQMAGVFFLVGNFDFSKALIALIVADAFEIIAMWFYLLPRHRKLSVLHLQQHAKQS